MPASHRGTTTFWLRPRGACSRCSNCRTGQAHPRCDVVSLSDDATAGDGSRAEAAVLREASIRQTRPRSRLYAERAWLFLPPRCELDQAEADMRCSGGIIRCARPCGPSGRGTVEQMRSWPAGPGRGPVAPDPGDANPERCARKTPRRTERRKEPHPALLSWRPAAPRLHTTCLLPSILRRLAFMHWRGRYGRSACSTAGRATTGRRSP